MQSFTYTAELIAAAIDGIGIAAIVLGMLVATARCASRWNQDADLFRTFRQGIGRAILLGLEFLVAADIIRTVAVTPTLHSVMLLGLIVLIRTFLSIALQVELEGKWPWQGRDQKSAREGRNS